jgi:hypothetical protein
VGLTVSLLDVESNLSWVDRSLQPAMLSTLCVHVLRVFMFDSVRLHDAFARHRLDASADVGEGLSRGQALG